MKFVTVNDLSAPSSRVWKRLPTEREFVVTSNGKPIALVTPLSDESFEDTISEVRRAKAINAMRRMQEISVSLGNDDMTLESINAIINDVRKRKHENCC